MTSICSGSPVPDGTKLPSGKTPAQKHGAVSKRKTVTGAKQPSLKNGSYIAHDLTSDARQTSCRSVCVGKFNTGLLQDAGYTLIQTFSPAIVPSTLPWIADIVTAILPCLHLHDSPSLWPFARICHRNGRKSPDLSWSPSLLQPR